MAIESGTDLAYFFETDDFGTSANFTSPALGAVNGIFDAETIEVELGGDVGVLAPQPTFKARTTDLTGVSEGSAVTISGTNYLVKNRMDDGTGTTDLQLEESASQDQDAGNVPVPISSDTFNVVDYGAAADGTTDDTSAIRLALTAAEAWADANSPSIATVYFPTGTYAHAPQLSDDEWPTSFPEVFKVTTDNIRFLGDGPSASVLSFYAPGLADPETNWYVNGDGQAAPRIKRGGSFQLDNSVTRRANITFEGLRITGNCDATGNIANGGQKYGCTVASNVFTNAGHGLSDGTILRFGNTAPAEINDGTTGYYVVNSATDTFQISDTLGGAVKTVTDEATTFNATDGDGWDWSHKAINGAGADPCYIKNCTLDRWRGEMVYSGGDNARTVNITDSTLEYCNASAVSTPSMVMDNCVVRYCYNGIENFARQSYHQISITNSTFTADPSRIYGESNGLAILTLPAAGAVTVDSNTFSDWAQHILLSEFASDCTINNNQFNGTGNPIAATYLNLYGDSGDYDDITISNNTATKTSSGGTLITLTWGANINQNNLKIFGNSLINTGGKWSRLISDAANVPTGQRANYEVYGNDLSQCDDGCTMTYDSPRAYWHDNTWGTRSNEPRDDLFTTADYTWVPTDSYSRVDNRASGDINVDLDADLQADMTLFPDGYTVELYNGGSTHSLIVQANATWNTLSSNETVPAKSSIIFAKVGGKLVKQ